MWEDFLKINHFHLWESFSTSLDLNLCCSTPSIPSFLLNSHLDPIILLLWCLGINFQVLFLLRESISSYMAYTQWDLSFECKASKTLEGSSLLMIAGTKNAYNIISAYPKRWSSLITLLYIPLLVDSLEPDVCLELIQADLQCHQIPGMFWIG